jgi:hypothetical protein
VGLLGVRGVFLSGVFSLRMKDKSVPILCDFMSDFNELREKYCANPNRVFDSLEAVCQEVKTGLQLFSAKPVRVTRLSGWPWIVNSIHLNAT